MRAAVTLEQCWHAVPGGTAVSILELVRALDERDDIDVVGVAARHRTPPPAPFVPPIPVAHLWPPRNVLYELWHLRLPLARVERATGPVDLVHATAIAFPQTDVPVVVTVHDLAFLQDERLATRHGHRFFRRGLELARQHARLVMCPSQSTMEECRAAGFSDDRLRLVPWGVRTRAPDATTVAAVRERFGLARPYVLFVGTVEPRKNLPRLLRAFALVSRRDVDLVLVGPAGWNESLAQDLAPLDDRVHALGFVSQADRDGLVAGAAVFCYPSLKEGFGLPVLEAMSLGTPVVTSRGTAMAEVSDGAAQLVDPLDERAIAAAIDEVLDDPALADRLRAHGRERASTYTWERTAARAVAVYEEALG